MERFSMKEYRPLTADERMIKVQEDIRDLKAESEPLVNRKRELEAILTELNANKKEWMPDDKFQDLSKTRVAIVKEKYNLEEKIRDVNKKINERGLELEKIKVMRKSTDKREIEKHLIDLRDKYTAFAADRTRVSSMRAMSAQFVEELNSALKVIND